MKSKKLTPYLFSFIPVLLFLTVLGIGNNEKKINLPTVVTHPLPCNFPNKGIVSGYSSTFTPNNTTPILYCWHAGINAGTPFPNVPQSITSGNSKLVMQADGNLVLYENNVACWSSGTSGTHASGLIFQTDGNLVLKDDGGGGTFGTVVYWASGISSTCANANLAYFGFQPDGNLVMRYPHNTDGNDNIDSYLLGATNTANGTVNNTHKIN